MKPTPQSHRTQRACENCAYVAGHAEDGPYCNRYGDRPEYPHPLAEDSDAAASAFQTAVDWEVLRRVDPSDVCDEHKAAPSRQEER